MSTATEGPKYQHGDIVNGHQLVVDGAGNATWVPVPAAPVAPITIAAPAAPQDGFGGMIDRIQAEASAGAQPRIVPQGMSYVVLQVILKEKLWGTGSGNLTELEKAINAQAALGYRLHTITTAASGSKGIGGGDRIQATMVFERI
jgi:hypothetical protein